MILPRNNKDVNVFVPYELILLPNGSGKPTKGEYGVGYINIYEGLALRKLIKNREYKSETSPEFTLSNGEIAFFPKKPIAIKQ